MGRGLAYSGLFPELFVVALDPCFEILLVLFLELDILLSDTLQNIVELFLGDI